MIDFQSGVFSYKGGNSFVHRTPAWAKILIIPIISVVFFNLPPVFSLFLMILQVFLASYLRFTLREQLRDLRAVLYYAFFLIFARVFSVIFADGLTPFDPKAFLLEKESVFMLLKLFCVMQSASIVFRTSTSLEIREGLENIERFIKRPFCKKPVVISEGGPQISTPVAEAVSLFICFIPMVSKIWNQSRRAWKARGGRNGVRMYLVLLPVLFSVGMKQAYNSARALSVRSNYNCRTRCDNLPNEVKLPQN